MKRFKFNHLVKIEVNGLLSIYRVYEDGREEFLTSVDLPVGLEDGELDNFFKLLGENLILDSPAARALLNL